LSTPPSSGEAARPPAAIEESDRFTPRFDDAGLMPCVTVDADTGAVLMLAWVNREALEATLATGTAHYWSRSRAELWKKGETSGALQDIVEVRTDCDQDSMLYLVRPQKREDACHTGRTTCFYRRLRPGPGGLERGLDFDEPSS
jgi:phosphoribosyl-AMP cyclohydrolase